MGAVRRSPAGATFSSSDKRPNRTNKAKGTRASGQRVYGFRILYPALALTGYYALRGKCYTPALGRFFTGKYSDANRRLIPSRPKVLLESSSQQKSEIGNSRAFSLWSTPAASFQPFIKVVKHCADRVDREHRFGLVEQGIGMRQRFPIAHWVQSIHDLCRSA
jgi:hypothetical protein